MPEFNHPSQVTMDPTSSGSEIHESGQTPIKMFVTKKGSQQRIKTPITIPVLKAEKK